MTSLRKRAWTGTDGQPRSAWLVDYRDQHGKRRAKQFTRKKDADAWRIRTEGQVAQGIHTPDSESTTIEEAAKLWIERGRADDLEPTTIAAYDQHVRLHIVPLCGARRLSQLTRPMVEGYRDKLVKTMSRPMAIRVLRSLRSIIADAQRRGMVAQNVADGVQVKRQARAKAKAVIPSKKALGSILRAAEASEVPMAQPLACLAIFAGLRASELRGLDWPSIDMKASTVTVSQRADATGKIGAPKSAASRRSIPLPAVAIAALRSWKLACPLSEADLVFPSLAGKAMSHRYMDLTIMRPLQASAKIAKPFTLHSFRHAAASLWIEQNVSAKRVQTWLGHSSIQVTFDTYGHLFAQADSDAEIASAIAGELLGAS